MKKTRKILQNFENVIFDLNNLLTLLEGIVCGSFHRAAPLVEYCIILFGKTILNRGATY